ncbi:MAG: glycosyltransferase [Bacteroidia bacterium]|nr:glycosyltransferase [Bacteroidia bacterium]
MKVLYLYLYARREIGSVHKKMMDQVAALNAMGVETRGAFFCADVQEPVALSSDVELVPFRRSTHRIWSHQQTEEFLYEAVDAYLRTRAADVDRIFLRYPPGCAPLLRLIRKYPGLFCLEHNTKELPERWEGLKRYQITWRPSGIKVWLLDFVYEYYAEKWYGPNILRHARMGLAVTNEIGAYEQARCRPHPYRVFTVSNGIAVDRIPVKPPVAFDGSDLRLLFMRGSQSDSTWHGVERLLHGLAAYRGPCRVHLYLLGSRFPREQALAESLGIQDQVTFTGHLEGEALTRMIDQSHLGIGSLGMHRIQLAEGAVLKVKEYMARGLPAVLAYQDVDVSYTPEFQPYVLHLPPDESPVSIEALIGFAQRVFADGDPAPAIRALAHQYLDARVKMAHLKSVLEQ